MPSVHRYSAGLLPAFATALALLCAGALAETSASSSLYERMGGNATIAAIASDLVDHSSSDPRTKRSWHKVTLTRVKGVLGNFLCSLTGGPCTYEGDSMREVHAGLNINEAEMYALVESLREIMIRHQVPLRERNELLALLAPMKRDVVTQ